jgi:hypothetical protein
MDIEEAFTIFNSRIIPSDSIYAKAKQHCDFLKQILENDSELSPKKFYYSGSYAKDTCISPLKDVDLVPHYNLEMCTKSDGDFYTPGIMLGKFFSRLQQTYSSRLTVRRQKRSIGIRFIDFDVELVPVFWDGNEDYDSFIPDREEKTWLKTSIPKHIEFFKSRDKTYRPYGKTVRLMKAWKNNHAVQLKGFALELLTVKALDKYGTSTHFGVNFYNIVRYVKETGFNEIVWFNDYISANQIKINQSPIMIVDPINPTNNICSDITEIEKRRILDKFGLAFKQSEWALMNEKNGEIPLARSRWRTIFGPEFPNP